ncbi:MraY family glycosyltransferase [Sinanaerobacter sp. ZZT-01]|uniref:glycosyltransferase family 4 protein n=1 Tax=Sinanaerobacter sp. ZZT-01 TaxID=3111540 RepID=UPI002D765F74|nr:MraY family glycosyltransferase [Sinanaerobacter sp. ZZT-01]WRR94616.1 MraY family glycosyltransferase [Sinanaerobacter sp. ZZT-01]
MSFGFSFVLPFMTAFFVSLLCTPLAIKIAPKIGAVDIPKDARRMHTKPMPRFGGIAIFLGTIAALFVSLYVALPAIVQYLPDGEPIEKMFALLAGGTLIYFVGIVDDLRGLPPKVKFLLQIICASVVFAAGIRISFITNHFGDGHGYLPFVISYFVTVLWIVGITNTINLIDGLDGLAAGVAAVASFAIAYTAYIHGMYTVTMAMLACAGGALGFLPFNFYPAKIFMGDAGSLFLGFMLAAVSIIGPVKGATILATVVPVLVLGVPIFDTAFAIFRRIINKRPIMEADKGHLHHRLMAAGMGQRRSVLTLYGISAIMSVAAILFSRDLFLESAGLFLIAGNFIYIFLTDAKNVIPQLKMEDKTKEVHRKNKKHKKKRK